MQKTVSRVQFSFALGHHYVQGCRFEFDGVTLNLESAIARGIG